MSTNTDGNFALKAHMNIFLAFHIILCVVFHTDPSKTIAILVEVYVF